MHADLLAAVTALARARGHESPALILARQPVRTRRGPWWLYEGSDSLDGAQNPVPEQTDQ
jgi:hypothetical protein